MTIHLKARSRSRYLTRILRGFLAMAVIGIVLTKIWMTFNEATDATLSSFPVSLLAPVSVPPAVLNQSPRPETWITFGVNNSRMELAIKSMKHFSSIASPSHSPPHKQSHSPSHTPSHSPPHSASNTVKFIVEKPVPITPQSVDTFTSSTPRHRPSFSSSTSSPPIVNSGVSHFDSAMNSSIQTTSGARTTYVSYCPAVLDTRRLGNRLFNVAALLHVAWTTGRQAAVPIDDGGFDGGNSTWTRQYDWLIDNIFDQLANKKLVARTGYDVMCGDGYVGYMGGSELRNVSATGSCVNVMEENSMIFDTTWETRIHDNSRSILLCGYFQSWKYFRGMTYVHRGCVIFRNCDSTVDFDICCVTNCVTIIMIIIITWSTPLSLYWRHARNFFLISTLVINYTAL